ncbi:hypothetical protein FHS07_003272 [Microbacterium proteolyticum]|uniref:Colicin import membrane protein n=1 Tax=Microbacterium proteolyticum TaxID=1572644 RepID=A0A7W5GHR5_9MICO|nr:hypothetical protein [Microbacterium proteolyticum]MBB3159537.1 hypothetical protein [Microbacterium proteolyticum]
MADESDGIEEAFDGQLRIAVTAAGRIGEALARAREDGARRAQAQSEQEGRELSSRFEAEKRAARVELGSVYRSDWWDRATPEQIGGVLTTARAWGSEDPEAERAEGRIRDELRTRYGVDVNNTGADPAAVQAAVEAERLRRQSETERQRSATEQAEAVALSRQADEADRAAEAARTSADVAPDEGEREQAQVQAEREQNRADVTREKAEPLYDSAERRERDADKLEQRGIGKEAVSAKMAADVSQGKPATAAVRAEQTQSAKARPNRSRSPKMQRTELGR